MKMLLVALLALTVMPLASTSWLTDCTAGCTGGGNGELICGSRPSSGLSGPVPEGTTGLRLGGRRVRGELSGGELRLLELGLGHLGARLDFRVPLGPLDPREGFLLLGQLLDRHDADYAVPLDLREAAHLEDRVERLLPGHVLQRDG